jgi:hypothetical protein
MDVQKSAVLWEPDGSASTSIGKADEAKDLRELEKIKRPPKSYNVGYTFEKKGVKDNDE